MKLIPKMQNFNVVILIGSCRLMMTVVCGCLFFSLSFSVRSGGGEVPTQIFSRKPHRRHESVETWISAYVYL